MISKQNLNKLLFVFFLLIAAPSLAVEDYTDGYWTETDPGADITVTSTKCDVSTMIRNISSTVEKDIAVDYLGEFSHDFEFYISAVETNGAGVIYHASNTQNADQTKLTSASEGVSVTFYNSGTYDLTLRQHSDESNDTLTVSLTTLYYATIERDATTVKLYVYSDSGRTTQISGSPLSVTYDSTRYRYIGGIASRGSTGFDPNKTITFYQQNLDLKDSIFYVAQDDDDGEERNDTTYDDGSSLFRIGHSTTIEYDGLLRFVTSGVDQGDTINRAVLVISARDTKAGTQDTTIQGVAEDNPAIWSSSARGSTRTKVASTVAWTIPATTGNTRYASPDITSVVQDIVDRAGFAAGNAMAFVVRSDETTNTTTKTWDPYNNGVAIDKAFLSIDYTEAATGTRRVIFIH